MPRSPPALAGHPHPFPSADSPRARGLVTLVHAAAVPVITQVLSGHLTVTADGRTVDLVPGSAIHLGTRLPHSVEALEPTKMQLIMLDARHIRDREQWLLREVAVVPGDTDRHRVLAHSSDGRVETGGQGVLIRDRPVARAALDLEVVSTGGLGG